MKDFISLFVQPFNEDRKLENYLLENKWLEDKSFLLFFSITKEKCSFNCSKKKGRFRLYYHENYRGNYIIL